MANNSLVDSFVEVVETGRKWRPYVFDKKQSIKHIVTWQEEFNLTGWHGWTYEHVVYKNEMINNKKQQEVSVRGIFKKTGGIGNGHDSIVALSVTFVRNMPIELKNIKEAPDPLKKFDNNPWKPLEIRYYPSPAKINSPVEVDLVRKRT